LVAIEPAQAAHLEGQVSTRRLGNSDLDITPVGFGAWAIGGTGYDFAWGKQDDADSIAAVHRSLELGVNWIDTAPIYGTGHSEEIVASAPKEWRSTPEQPPREGPVYIRLATKEDHKPDTVFEVHILVHRPSG
jgi:diketogulonate reductase-like aldo/keto reductase